MKKQKLLIAIILICIITIIQQNILLQTLSKPIPTQPTNNKIIYNL